MTAADQRTAPPPIIGVVGPTASGKTELALALAATWPVEIVVADSRQVYRGMDVGTAKPDATARARVPHHLLDVVDPDKPFTVADWVARARETIAGIGERGRIAMLVGGTGLYVSAVVDGYVFGGPPPSEELRATLRSEVETSGLAMVAQRLVERDPDAAARTDLNNARRVIRALERTERPDARTRNVPYAGRVALVGVSRTREVLYRRIDDRARRLFAEGLLEETRALLASGYGADLRPMSGHGYQEAMRHIAGEWSLEEAIDVTARRTRQYAKRQLTWFRAMRSIMWVEAGDRPADDPDIVERVNGLIRSALG
jgi:tRNA dimethylallyltransferase